MLVQAQELLCRPVGDTPNSTARGRIGADVSPRVLARVAGLLYLVVIVGGFFAQGYVSAALVVPGDAAATARNVPFCSA
ncbi:MAG: DUF4386 family protein [Chloroflexi bacterium]|nr:MAG: DUF4386 family protein [Chloroflexota bacterium]